MKYLHYPLVGKKGNKVKVKFDAPCKVLLMNGTVYSHYEKGISFTAYGGYKETSPVVFKLKKDGNWHVVIELNGYFNPDRINASVEIN